MPYSLAILNTKFINNYSNYNATLERLLASRLKVISERILHPIATCLQD